MQMTWNVRLVHGQHVPAWWFRNGTKPTIDPCCERCCEMNGEMRGNLGKVGGRPKDLSPRFHAVLLSFLWGYRNGPKRAYKTTALPLSTPARVKCRRVGKGSQRPRNRLSLSKGVEADRAARPDDGLPTCRPRGSEHRSRHRSRSSP